MKPFQEMLRRVSSSIYYDQMLQFTLPLEDHFGVNHFWYYRITFTGCYCYIGTHAQWNEFCFTNDFMKYFPCLRHPDILQKGINLMKASSLLEYKKILDLAWEKFQINFTINFLTSIPEGVEAFGFATKFNDPYAEQRLLNDFSLLLCFIKIFKKKHKKLFYLLYDNEVNLEESFGPYFYELPNPLAIPNEREKFLCKIGLGSILCLTKRELDVLKYISNGYPASYIAQQLKLSTKTIENYINNIKEKLSCFSKVELIQKAQEIHSLCFFHQVDAAFG